MKNNYEKTDEVVLPYDFQRGEVYYLPKGNSPFKLVDWGYDSHHPGLRIWVSYLSSPKQIYTNDYQIKLVKAKLKKEKQMIDTLYQVKNNKDAYGTYLTKNSEGKLVLEMKAGGGYESGQVVAFDKSELEEVLPYTVDVAFFPKGSVNTHYSYFAEAGQVEPGDMVILDDNTDTISLVVVRAVDTKSRKATKTLKGIRLKGDPIG